MRMELEPLGVPVVTVQPGGMASKFGDNAEHEIQFPEDSPYASIGKFIQGRAKISQAGAQSTSMPLLKLLLPLKTLDFKMKKPFGLDQL